MSSISRAIFGNRPRDPGLVNTNPQAYQNLANPVSSQIQQMLQNPAQWQGGYAAPVTGAEQQGLTNVTGAANQVGVGNPGTNALTQQSNGVMNPYAASTGLERFGLGQVTQQAFGQSGQQNAANMFLGQQLGGQMNPYAGAIGLGAPEQQGLNAIQQTAFGPQSVLQDRSNQQLLSLVNGGGANPYTQQLMDAAVRPITDNFSDQALQQRGLYTGAGQQIQGMGSSPFAQASARLSGNVANAIGDTTAQLGANLFGQQQQAQLQALGMAQQQPGLQLNQQLAATQALGLPRENQQLGLNNQAAAYGQMQQNQFNAAGLTDQFTGNALQRALAGLNAAGTEQTRQGTAFENAANRSVDASTTLGSQNLAQQQAQLQAQMQNLQAQQLPRLVQQLGIDGGLNQFNTQQQQLLSLLGLSAPLPNAGMQQYIPAYDGTTGAIGDFFSAFAGGAGSMLGGKVPSDRRVKRDIQYAGTTPNGTKVYRFRYNWEAANDPLHMGVMSDEVRHIPGAVLPSRAGVDLVDYTKVLAHG